MSDSPMEDARIHTLEPISDKKIAQIQMALSCLSHPDMGAREHGLKVLVNIGLPHGSLLLLTEAIPSLVELMRSPSPVISMFATFVLSSAAVEPANQSSMRKHGIIPLSLSFLDNKNPDILEKSLLLLANLTLEGHSRLVLLQSGGLPLLLSLLSSPQSTVVLHTTRVLRNLFFELETQVAFVEGGGTEVLVRLISSQKLSGPSANDLRVEWSNLVCILSYQRSSSFLSLSLSFSFSFFLSLLLSFGSVWRFERN